MDGGTTHAGDPLVSFITIGTNGLPHTMRCVESLFRHAPKCPWEVIVVDNASDDGTGAWLDAYTQGRDQVAHPEMYGLTNVTTPACDLASANTANTVKMPFASSLVCSTDTLIAGDTSRYEFADTVHPTPFAYQLLARFVAKRMVESGWL